VFITPVGLYELTVMQFGLCNAPATFQQMIDNVLLEELQSGAVEVYIDNILIHTKIIKENRRWTHQVLSKLEKNQLYCWVEKCLFKKETVEFLGVTISYGEISISKEKTQAMAEKQPPTTRKVLRRFLGMANYHQKFIKGYSQIACPLHDLTCDVPYV
jgi:hypothetical protein